MFDVARGALALVLAALALSCAERGPGPSPRSTPPPPSSAPLAEFCKSYECLPYESQLAKLSTSCVPAEAGPCDAYLTITYPRYPVEVRRFYDASGALIGARVDLVEHAGGRTLYGELPTCSPRTKAVCADRIP